MTQSRPIWSAVAGTPRIHADHDVPEVSEARRTIVGELRRESNAFRQAQMALSTLCNDEGVPGVGDTGCLMVYLSACTKKTEDILDFGIITTLQ
jgi:hypothetical protein